MIHTWRSATVPKEVRHRSNQKTEGRPSGFLGKVKTRRGVGEEGDEARQFSESTWTFKGATGLHRSFQLLAHAS